MKDIWSEWEEYSKNFDKEYKAGNRAFIHLFQFIGAVFLLVVIFAIYKLM